MLIRVKYLLEEVPIDMRIYLRNIIFEPPIIITVKNVRYGRV